MCGRYLHYAPVELLERAFALDLGGQRPNLKPRYNIAPTPFAPIVSTTDGKRSLSMAHWGLVPSWAKDRSGAAKLINARGETVASKPSFRSAFKGRRWLVPVNGFYEWTGPKGNRQPYVLEPTKGDLMAFGVLYERKREDDGSTLVSFTIVTTAANDDVEALHNRMPLILAPETWLEGAPDPAKGLIGQRPLARSRRGRSTAASVTCATTTRA